jgi:hypothetical protein
MLLAPGCGGTETVVSGSSDGGVVRDARVPDVTPDHVVHGDAPIGASCTSSEQCAGCPSPTAGEGGACISEDGGTCLDGPFTGGYCTVSIAECSEPQGALWCPIGSICFTGGPGGINVGGDYCLASCGDGGVCRAGYDCCMVRGYPVCAPAIVCGSNG